MPSDEGDGKNEQNRKLVREACKIDVKIMVCCINGEGLVKVISVSNKMWGYIERKSTFGYICIV